MILNQKYLHAYILCQLIEHVFPISLSQLADGKSTLTNE